MADVHARQMITVAGPAPAPVTAAPRARASVIVDGVRVQLDGDAEAGGASDLHFTLTDAATGRPVNDLQPYLAAAGHIVIMRADGRTFAHEHAEVTDSRRPPGIRPARHHVRPRARRARRIPDRRDLPVVGAVPPRRR